MHHAESGSRDAAETVLCLHGEPTWSYLYRKMLPRFADAGYRALAPDLVGFGRSDKPAERADYTYQRHVDWLTAWLHAHDLRGVTLVAQDWGGLLGLRLATAEPERFRRLVLANTFLPTGDERLPDAFFAWQKHSQGTPELKCGRIVARACVTDVPDAVAAAYDAPFPDESYKAGTRQFPLLVPSTPEDPASAANRRAWTVLGKWTKPVLTAFGDSDPIMRGADRLFQKRIPGCAGQPHTTIERAGHFLQEDQGESLADVVIDFIESTT